MVINVVPLVGILFIYLGAASRALQQESGLFPMVFNLAKHAEITSNATCGENGPETFCKLVQHVEKQTRHYVQCGVCDATSSDPRRRHPITNAIDGTHAWWQSPSITNGKEYNWVTVTLDLKQVYQVAYVVVTAANSPRPGNWILEHSVDGVNYSPWQYFAMSDSECWNVYGVAPTVGIPRYKDDDEVICTSFYSKLNPLENGEIHTSLVNGRPGVKGPSEMLMDFTRARYIRLRLQKIQTLYADLMTFTFNDPKQLDPSVTNRYFYSIKDISVGGQCICYGHADQCPIDPETGEMYCLCEGNTCGANCDRCCPLYNQIPWQPGTYSESFQCEMCNCFSHADSCVYNQTVADLRLSMNMDGIYKGGGVCVECRHHTMGINCELCEDGYYHPPNVSQHDPDACRMCLCTGPGSTGLCVKDSSMEMHGIFAGDCFCREGFCGPRCEECAPGYMNYPLCEPCPCDVAGTLGMEYCQDICICKAFVCGERCDQCMPGYYNLDQANPEGCQPCFCFGLSYECQSLTWGRTQLTSLKHWVVTDLAGSGVVTPTRSASGVLTIKTEDASTLNKAIYWGAPKAFVGNKILSYGGVLRYSFTYSINCTDDLSAYLANYDLIIEGSGMRFGHSGQYWQEDLRNVIAINMTESGWRHIDGSTSPRDSLVPKEEFMIVLADIDRLLIRASYHIYQTEAQLLEFSLDVASRTGTGPPMYTVEQCSCPEGYSGTSCEICASGYYRVTDTLLSTVCEPCVCHGHSDICDPYTGQCLECQHYTTGFHCDECAVGCHGDPLLGPEGCIPCACPLEIESNNFAETCAVDPNDPGDYICVGCPEGYDGKYCEICDRGYYGDPMTIGSYCRPCDCNGNMDNSLPEPCDRMTGECFGCLGNTHGKHCELCNEGYYRSSQDGKCKECACNLYGSISTSCDPDTGQCPCKDRYMGHDCGMCKYGYGNIALGCVPCKCDVIGSESDVCDPVTGQCPCRPGVTGHQCTECKPGYFGFSEQGCEDCQCHVDGSVTIQCQTNGECQCHSNVIGKYCNQCLPNYWGLSSGSGCKPCMCDPIGSQSTQCDLETGQCHCRPGVIGQHCDLCAPGYYGFSVSGCLKCPTCSIPGQVCDPVTGHCICPPNTEGLQCDRCVPGAWGYDPLTGCKLCNCDPVGSISKQCDVNTGLCTCHHSYTGMSCDQCPDGYYDFPFCAPCACDVRGTRQDTCQNGTCTCDNTGKCQCKDGVVGPKCDRCADDSFGLNINNTRGCTKCFCFGRTKSCDQAPYRWSEKQLPDQFVSVFVSENSTFKPSLQGFIVIPSNATTVTLHPSHLDLPLYFSLPQSVHKDQTLSYNGRLTFTLTNALPAPAYNTVSKAKQPLLYIVGNYRIHLQYMGDVGDTDSNIHTVDVTLREDLWKDDSGKPVSRETFMMALQNVQHWLIKATDVVGITERQLIQASSRGQARLGSATLQNIVLEVAVPSTQDEVNAFGIEMCRCPPEYEGLSCQNPIPGYYRKRVDDFMDSPNVLDLIGISIPCQCYGHSDKCDRESGFCTNCQHNTVGRFCHQCAAGYYGNPTQGTPYDCKPCACPLSNPENNFSPTCVSVGSGADYVCDNCAEGYTGTKCQSCDIGYYGNPMVIGGSCQPCDCNVGGTIGKSCDPVTGQCHCYPGITGLKCDKCLPRHVVVGARCVSCNEGCTGILFAFIDKFNEELDHFDISAVLPYARLNMVQESLELLEERRALVGNISRPSLRQVTNLVEEIKINTRILQDRVENELENVDVNGISAEDLWFEAEDMAGELLAVQQMAKGIVQQLQENKTLGNGKIDIDETLEEAKDILERLKRQRLDLEVTKLNAGTELLLSNITKNDIKKMSSQASGPLNDLKARLDAIIKSLGFFEPLIDEVDDMISEAEYWNDDNVRFMERIQMKLADIEDKKDKSVDILLEADKINNNAKRLLTNESQLNYKESRSLLEVMQAKGAQVEIKTDLFEKGLPGVEPLYHESETHARSLQEQAQKLEDEFAVTRLETEAALRAARIYGVMADNITGAYNTSLEAVGIAEKVNNILHYNDSDSVFNQIRELLELSKDLTDNSTLLDRQAKALRPHLDSALIKSENCKDNMKQAETILDQIKTSQNLTKAADKNLTELNYNIITTLAKTARAADKTIQIDNELETNIKVKVKEMASVSMEDISMATTSVNAARKKFSDLMNLTRLLDEQKDRVHQAGLAVGNSLLELKEKIRQARQLAKSIKLSLHHTGSCARRYEADLKTSMSNSILLHFKTTEPNKDMLLFMVHNKNTSEYMIIELVSNQIRFSWDVGGGLGLITHFLSVDGSTRTEENWYHIYAERHGSQGRLTVKLMDRRLGEGQSVSGVSPPTHTMLDVDQQTPVFVGGAPPDYDVPLIVRSTSFSGCIGGVFIDGKDIGLFDFRELYGQGCGGCHIPPGIETGGALTYQFDGAGYSSRKDDIKHTREFSLTFRFRSYWKNALLFFTHNPQYREYISVELFDGYVVFKYTDNNIMKSRFKYNHNQWVKVTVQASWNLEKAALIINNNDEVIESKRLTRTHMDNPVLYFGGVPPTLNITQYGIVPTGFLGCIKDMHLGPQIINLLDGSGVVVGIQLGCNQEALNTVGFEGTGFVELPSYDMGKDGSLFFSFLTYHEDGLMILAKGINPSVYYSVSMLNGIIHVWFNAGIGRAEIMTLSRYDDGKRHGVSVIKTNRRIDLYIDDIHVGNTQLPQGASRISSMRGELGGLFIGGIPEGLDAFNKAASTSNFRGCISDIGVNSEPLMLGRPLDFSEADIGRCDLKRLFPERVESESGQPTKYHSFTITITLPTSATTTAPYTVPSTVEPTEEPTSCAAEGVYSVIAGAQAFGDLVNSYAEILVKKRDIVKDFNMTVEVRTYYKTGMVFFITNELQDDYVVVQLNAGRVVVVYNDRKSDTQQILTNILISDGMWHTIRLMKDFKRITISVDDHTPLSSTITRKIDVIAPIYVGGFDPRFGVAEGVVPHSFKGCMRRFNLNGNPVDLANSKRVMGVRPCFRQVERGVHFDGYSYATYAEIFEIKSHLRIEFDFKTTKQDGVIISISNYRDNPALALELHQGWLKFSAVNRGGSFISVDGRCQFCLCDNRWHKVVAEYINNAVTLTLDDGRPKVGVGGDDMSLDLRNELYIGGIPGFGNSGISQTKEFFVGCLRNLKINGKLVEWHETFELENVHVAGCPIEEG